jgi:uncharacterized membrane protein YfcA
MSGPSFAFVLAGFCVGILSGLMGIGGAILLVPLLVMGFGFSQQQAQGTSLGALVPPIGIFAAIAYYRNGYLDVKVAALIGLGFLFGALGGAMLVPLVPQVWLKRLFATVLVFAAARFIFPAERKAGAVVPGILAVAALWLVYIVRRTIGKRGEPPKPPTRPPGDEYYI